MKVNCERSPTTDNIIGANRPGSQGIGNYKSALHKFTKALKIDKENETAKQELDERIPLESVPSLKKQYQNGVL